MQNAAVCVLMIISLHEHINTGTLRTALATNLFMGTIQDGHDNVQSPTLRLGTWIYVGL